MKKSLLGGLVLSLTMGGAAMAADMAVKARPAYAPAFSWTGCYIGVEGGGAWGRSKHTFINAPGFGTTADITPWFNISGGLAGGEAGCNAMIGDSTWVMGSEFDLSWTNKKGSSAETGLGGLIFIGPAFAGVDETRERWISTSRVRVGPSWGPLWGYITGGFAAANVRARVTTPAIFGGLTVDDNKTLYGWTAGLGAEYAWFNAWSVKVEYLYARFENRVFFDQLPFTVSTRSLNIDDHIVRVGLNWRFSGLGKGPVVASY